MSIATAPAWVIFVATVMVVVLAIEAGFRLGCRVRQRSEDEKESAVSATAGAILGLAGFMLAFTFGISSDRLHDRKTLLRDEANAIGTAWLRSDFLPEADRAKAAGLFLKYVDDRLGAARAQDLHRMEDLLAESRRIQHQLWEMAVQNARKDMNSDVAALYIESLNQVIEIHTLRVAVALHPQIPAIIWIVLYALVILGMLAVGYQTAIAGSARRSRSAPILALSFSLVIALIVSLDRPQSDLIGVPQRPLIDLRASMAANAEADSGLRRP